MSSSGGILADRNRLSSQSSASSACRNSLIPPENVINESEFPSLGRAPYGKLFYSRNSIQKVENIKKITVFAANLMRTSDGNSLSTQNVEFRIQNEDFPAL
ncbi:unnamed protein product, partial [Wuchereria bancrofti]